MRRLTVRPRLRMETRRGGYFESLNTCEAMELELMSAEPGLPLRKDQVLLQAPNRCAAIGVATLLVLRQNGKHWVVLAPIRGKGMPHRTGQYHVVPSGMMAPPYSVRETVLTELSEELAGVRIRSLSEFYFTGVAVNLLNLRPEICTMLVVDRPQEFCVGEEFLPGARVVPFGSDEHLIRTLSLSCRCITPPGAAALFLGARVLRRLLKA